MAMKRQTKAPAAKAMAARCNGLRCRKLSECAAAVAVGDSEIRLGISAGAMVEGFTGSDFVRTGSWLTIAAGSTVFAGTALVLETITAGTA